MTANPAAASAPAAEEQVVYARSIPAEPFCDAIAALGITHVVTVPDTNLRTLLDVLQRQAAMQLLTVCTEDEAIGINAGLHITGHRPMLLIQNNGLLACVNTLKAIALDARVPTLMLIGQYGRDVGKQVEDNSLRSVRLLEPTLAVWGVPSVRLDGPEDLPLLAEAYGQALEQAGPAAAIVGAPTC